MDYPHPDTPQGSCGGIPWWDQSVGGAKEIVNTLGQRAAADLSESTGIRFVEKGTAREIDLAAEGKKPPAANQCGPDAGCTDRPGLPGGPQRRCRPSWPQGANSARSCATPRSLQPDLKKALTDTVSQAEALGQAALEQAQCRSGGHRRHGDYIDRYHGPDDITLKDGRLTEWEAKASKTDSTSVAKDKHGNRKGSRDKNLLRAKTMTRKEKKIGMPSNRQGGPYTPGEIDLWRDVKNLGGYRQHISVHTNTETGWDHDGNIAKQLDDLIMENFDALKQAIREAFKR